MARPWLIAALLVLLTAPGARAEEPLDLPAPVDVPGPPPFARGSASTPGVFADELGDCPDHLPVRAFKAPNYRFYYRLPTDPDYRGIDAEMSYATADDAEAAGYFREPDRR